MDNHTCRVCQEYFSSYDGDRIPVILLGCGHTICSTCAENQSHYGTGSSLNPFPSILVCPSCHIDTFLPTPSIINDQILEKQKQQQNNYQNEKNSSINIRRKPPTIIPPNSFFSTSNRRNEYEAISSRLPINYNMLPPNAAAAATATGSSNFSSGYQNNNHHNNFDTDYQQQQQLYPLCDVHALPRAFYCPSHGTASCLRCINEKHKDCPFKACEVKEAKPILLQSLNTTRRTLENALSRSESLKQNLSTHHIDVETKIYESHCSNVFAWMEKCMEIGMQSLGNAHLLHQQRLGAVMSRVQDLERSERMMHAALRGLDTADSLPATALIDAIPLLKQTVEVPDVSLIEEQMRGIDDPPGPIPPSILPPFAAQYGERVLVADHGWGFLKYQNEGNPYSAKPNAGFQDSSSERTSLYLVDVETKTIVASFLNSNEMKELTKISDKEKNEQDVIEKVIDSNQFPTLKSPNGICEVITEVEVEDKSSLAGILYHAQRERLRSLGLLNDDNENDDDAMLQKGTDNDLNFYNISPSRRYDIAGSGFATTKESVLSPFWKNIVTASPSASAIVNKNVNRDEKTFAKNNNNNNMMPNKKFSSSASSGKPTKIVLRTEFAICDTLGHRIVLIDATTGKMTRQIKQTLRGTCLNEFSPFSVCPVMIPLEDNNKNGDEHSRNDENRSPENINDKNNQVNRGLSQGSNSLNQSANLTNNSINFMSQNTSFAGVRSPPPAFLNNNNNTNIDSSFSQLQQQQHQPNRQETQVFDSPGSASLRDTPISRRRLQNQQKYEMESQQNRNSTTTTNNNASRGGSPGREAKSRKDELRDPIINNNSKTNQNNNINSYPHTTSQQADKTKKQEKTAALVVTDCDNHRIHLIDAETGEFLRFWGNFRGSSADEFWSPLGVTQVPDTALFAVCDSGNHRIVVIHIGHSGSLFCIDLFSGVKRMEYQRVFPSSVCVIPETTYSTTETIPLNTNNKNNQLSHSINNSSFAGNKNNNNQQQQQQDPSVNLQDELITSVVHHQVVQLAIACKQPAAENKNDCVILLDFSFDLTKVIRTRVENGGPTMFSGMIFGQNSAVPLEAVTTFRISKIRSEPARTLFEIPVASKNNNTASPLSSSSSSASKSSLGILSTPHRHSLTTPRHKHTEVVFDMLNYEFSRSANVLEQFQVLNAIAPCPLTLTTIKASSGLQSAESWTRRMFSDTQYKNNNNNTEDQDGTTKDMYHHNTNNNRFMFSNGNSGQNDNRNRHVVNGGSSVLVISDRNNRCVWTLDPITGRLHDRIGSNSDKNKNSYLFGAPVFVHRVSPNLRIDPIPIHAERIFAEKEIPPPPLDDDAEEENHHQKTPNVVFAKEENPLQKRESNMFPSQNNNNNSTSAVPLVIPLPNNNNNNISAAAVSSPQPTQNQQQQQHQQLQEHSTLLDPKTLDPRRRLTRLYKKYNPSKLSSIDGLLKQFEGAEEALFRTARDRYGPEPLEKDDAKIYAVDPRSRLVRYYQKYNNAKLEFVDKTIQQFDGMLLEDTLFAMLREKYGPEPVPGENFDESQYISEQDFLKKRRDEKLKEIEDSGKNVNQIIAQSGTTTTTTSTPPAVVVVTVPTRSGSGPIISTAQANNTAVAPTTETKSQQQTERPDKTKIELDSSAQNAIAASRSSSVSVDGPVSSQQLLILRQQRQEQEQADEAKKKLLLQQQQQQQQKEVAREVIIQPVVNENENVATSTNANITNNNNLDSPREKDRPTTSAENSPARPLEKEELAKEDEDMYNVPDEYGEHLPSVAPSEKSQSQSPRNNDEQEQKIVEPVAPPTAKERLTRFYQKYNSEKLSSVDSTLKLYEGKEEELFKNLVSKYGKEPLPDEEIVPVAPPPPAAAGAKKAPPAPAASPPKKGPTTASPQKTAVASPPAAKSPQPKTPAVAINVTPSSSPEEWKQRFERFYKKYNAEKLPTLDDTLKQWKGKEIELMKNLITKYGAEPAVDDEPKKIEEVTKIVEATKIEETAKVEEPTKVEEPKKVEEATKMEEPKKAEEPKKVEETVPKVLSSKERLTRFYQKYNPEKISSVDSTLKLYEGKEEELFKNLITKYGKEPLPDEEIVPVAPPPAAAPSTSKTPAKTPTATPAAAAAAKKSPAPPATSTKAPTKAPAASSPLSNINVTPSSSPEEWRKRFERFYKKYNAEKLATLDDTLKPWKGKEIELMKNLISKYGTEPPVEEEPKKVEEPKKAEQEQAKADPAIVETSPVVPVEVAESEATKEAKKEVPVDAESKPIEKNEVKTADPDPASSPSQTKKALTEKERLTRFYQKYNPEKISSVDETLKSWKGKEESLFTSLIAKYGKEPLPDEEIVPVAPPPPAAAGAKKAPPAPAASPPKKGPTTASPQKTAVASPPAAKSPQPKTPAVAINVTPSSSPEEWKQRFERFYKKYNADKLPTLDDTLKQWKGKEIELMKNLISKYGTEPAVDEEPKKLEEATKIEEPKKVEEPKKAEEATKIEEPKKIDEPVPKVLSSKERLTRFYQKYNPEKISSVDETLKQWKGKEESLFNNLITKYGKEPLPDEEIVPVAPPPAAALSTAKTPTAATSAVASPKTPAPSAKKSPAAPPAAPSSSSSPKKVPVPATTTSTTNVAVKLSSSPAEWKKRLESFYQKYNPEKLSSVEETMKQWKGKEESLFRNLITKYGPEPDDVETEGGASNTAKQESAPAAATAAPKTTPSPQKSVASPSPAPKKSPVGKKSSPGGGSSAASSSGANKAKAAEDAAAQYYRTRLEKFYAKYAPQKTEDDMNKLLKEFKGKESRLFEILCGKYGPEP